MTSQALARPARSIWLGRIGKSVAFLAFALALLAFWGTRNALSVPVARTASVALVNLPANTPPLRVALLSDIHWGNFGMAPARLNAIVTQVNATKPDVILLAGDFVTGENQDGAEELAAGLTAPLARLQARQGIFAVLGNHDHWTAPLAIRDALTRAGVVVLENEAIRRGPFAIVGIGDRFSGHDDLAASIAAADRAGGVPIVFTHSPDIAPELPDRFPLLLAGHTHCGQVVLPWLGPLIRYSRWQRLYDPRYRCGRIMARGRETIVTGGLGGTVPIRFNAVPDWWLIQVRP